MSLRTQLSIFTGALVAAAVVIVSLIAYFAAQDRLRGQIDNTLVARQQAIGDAPGLPRPGSDGADRGPGGGRTDPFGSSDTFFQVIDRTGAVIGAPENQQTKIPVSGDDIAVANRERSAILHDATADGVHMRVLTSPGEQGHAVQIARSLAEVDASLSGLRRILLGAGAAGVILAAILGLVVAQRALRPVARLTSAAEHVAATQELDAPIDVRRNDEIGRLAGSFNAMLRALHESRLQQQQLVMDASHELRTPLTSLRTNIEVLMRAGELPEGERRELLEDVRFEIEELTKIVRELVELASEQRPDTQSFEDVRLDRVASAVVERAGRRGGAVIHLDAAPALVVGSYSLLERAAGNFVDNAIKWSPPGAPVEVTVSGGRLTVHDHGPGISDQDRPRVFDRFYRADAARSKPGSGLGLAIVKQIIDAHGGRVWIEPAPGGGTIAGFELASVPLETGAPASQPAPELPAASL